MKLDERLKIVATGTGRCGTMFFARLLQGVGIKCGHEQVFTQHPLSPRDSSKWDADSSLFVMPFVDQLDDEIQVVHLVRNPVNCIESFLRIGYFDGEEKSSGLMLWWKKYCPVVFEQPNEECAAVSYWVNWNRIMDGFHFRHRIEDDPRLLLARLGIRWDEPLTFDRWCNHKDGKVGRKLEKDKVYPALWDEMIEMAEAYGYEVDR